jgi:hypothetical protein
MLVVASFLSGCESEKLTELEKQNKELHAKIEKQESAKEDYELQGKCSSEAKMFFSQGWDRDRDTIILDYWNHYNKAMNKCFISVEFHYHYPSNSSSWINDISIWDVLENEKYGQYSESHDITPAPNFQVRDSLIECEVVGHKCKTIDEFNNLRRPYLQD